MSREVGSDEDADAWLANIRAAAPRARRAALTQWQAAFAWTWLAWRLHQRLGIYRAAEAFGYCLGIVCIGFAGWVILLRAVGRGAGAMVSDGWRALWRRG